jgi:hypothetical protein
LRDPQSCPPNFVEEKKQEEQKNREKWESDVQGLLAEWRQVFHGVGGDLDLYLSYSREYRTRRY